MCVFKLKNKRLNFNRVFNIDHNNYDFIYFFIIKQPYAAHCYHTLDCLLVTRHPSVVFIALPPYAQPTRLGLVSDGTPVMSVPLSNHCSLGLMIA